MDAQTCIPDEKFDIIHVGAAVEHFPQIFFDKMKDGGYMWIPVGPKNAFKNIFLCNKKGEEMIKSELMTRSYAEMTTKEEQLSHYDEVIDENNSIDDELERFLDV
jgi:protein-L-isoaspartate O-methyltransferase